MKYSVFRPEVARYDYYETPVSGADIDAPARATLPQGEIGITPAQASWKLPGNAKPVGSGKRPVGMIATEGFEIAGLSPLGLAAVALAGFMAWKYLR